MKNILVPIDFSENAENALRYAQIIFKENDCNFYLLHVAPLLSTQKNTTSSKKYEVSKLHMSKLNTRAKKWSNGANHRFNFVVEQGFFIETIKKQFEEKQIDLIVMGTKGVSGLREKVVGSNAGDVITKVQCNTLVIPKDVAFQMPAEIAFPTDFNIFYTHGILNSISEMLKLNFGKIRVMNVLKRDTELNSEQLKNKEYLKDYLIESFLERYSFHTITNRKVKAAIQCFVESRDVDMIIMVAKNLNFIQQILFDSIVEKISFHTTVPFYVVHEQKQVSRVP
ncbi:universal stress protein [Flagellimonas sp. S174]|uniref:universal stress protein n=1 Tax=Flagellimonas sp. S174 TaxID=3410790 RepID=UPI003BF60C57